MNEEIDDSMQIIKELEDEKDITKLIGVGLEYLEKRDQRNYELEKYAIDKDNELEKERFKAIVSMGKTHILFKIILLGFVLGTVLFLSLKMNTIDPVVNSILSALVGALLNESGRYAYNAMNKGRQESPNE